VDHRKGKLASVSILSGPPVAFKHVTVRERSGELTTEFEVLRSLYNFCDTESFFGVPRPLALYDPHKSTSFISAGGSAPSESRRRPLRSPVRSACSLVRKVDTVAYAIDHIRLLCAHHHSFLVLW
jgi:hypothetical protein